MPSLCACMAILLGRWFVLTGSQISYFEDEKQSSLKGMIKLADLVYVHSAHNMMNGSTLLNSPKLRAIHVRPYYLRRL